MPDPTPSPIPHSNALGSTGTKPASLLPPPGAAHFPGRGVTVQYGAKLRPEIPAAHPRARVFLTLDNARWALIQPTPAGKPQRETQPGPAVSVIAAGVPHAFTASGLWVAFWLQARFVRETTEADVTGITVTGLAALAGRDKLIGELAEVFRPISRGKKRHNALYIESIGTGLATHVVQILFGGEPIKRNKGGLPPAVLDKVIAHIDQHYADPYDPEALARLTGYSRGHFQRLFERSLEQPLREYYRGCEVEAGIVLLQTTEKKEIDIALDCGFCDETMMTRWFRKLGYDLPSEYRKAADGG